MKTKEAPYVPNPSNRLFNDSLSNKDATWAIDDEANKLLALCVITGGNLSCVQGEVEARLRRIIATAKAITDRSVSSMEFVKGGEA